MPRKKKHQEHINHERWLISYADFITLLFAFFVVMYSVSAVNEGKYRVLAEALEGAFRSTPRSMTPVQVGNIKHDTMIDPGIKRKKANPDGNIHNDPPSSGIDGIAPGQVGVPEIDIVHINDGNDDQAGEIDEAYRAIENIADRVEQSFQEMVSEGLITVIRNRNWVEVEIRTQLLFESGKADLSEKASTILIRIANILEEFPNKLFVEGFTDNVPISTDKIKSNWELSSLRAISVIHLFGKNNIDPKRLAAVGYGEHRPVADNDTEEGRRKNRKVVLVILADRGGKRMALFDRKEMDAGETSVQVKTQGSPGVDEASAEIPVSTQ